MGIIKRSKETFNRVRFLDHYMEGHKGFIAGGCFKNIFKNQKIKDLDIFFENEKDFLAAVEHFKCDENYILSYENNNTISYKNKNTNIRIELIRNTYGTAEEIIAKFDFSITKFAYARKQEAEGITYYNLLVDTFFEDLANSKLVIDGDLLYPISSFERSYRYRTYGFGLCRESKAKLIEALKNSNTDDLSNDLYFGLD